MFFWLFRIGAERNHPSPGSRENFVLAYDSCPILFGGCCQHRHLAIGVDAFERKPELHRVRPRTGMLVEALCQRGEQVGGPAGVMPAELAHVEAAMYFIGRPV